eukprot:TRINITY_DN881_c0_g1_i1.p1 TRINITY_DN881_c0_g1~~TRINITY_DN881_c0_g1_i1.p1  ORF type:complete len:311 (+),score=87.35 TRINITY_DN881_c0_g1_i1:76-1008(+)
MKAIIMSSAFLAGAVASDEPCTAPVKQPALYLTYHFDPPLKQQNAYDLSAETVWNHTSDMKKTHQYGVYAAHPVGFAGSKGEISGYFGTQVFGKAPADEVTLLFSIWDGRRSGTCADDYDPSLAPNATWCGALHAFPVTDTCKRHCNDCGLHPGWHNTTGVQCGGQKVTVSPGDAIRTRIHRVEADAKFTFAETPKIEYQGSVWRATAQVVSAAGVAAAPFEIGKIFFESLDGGLDRFSAFHEHIGCVPCSAFYESEIRRGPWEGGADARAPPAIVFTPPKNHPGCTKYDVAVDNDKHEAQFFSGPGTGQ